MMDHELQRDLGRLEGTVEAQAERLDAIDKKLELSTAKLNAKLDKIIQFQERQKGAGRFGLILASGLGTVAGFLVTWLKS